MEGLTNKKFTKNTQPLESDVESAIKNGFVEINLEMQAIGYDIPMDINTLSNESLIYLKITNCLYAAYHSENIRGSVERVEFFRDEYNRRIKKIGSGIIVFKNLESDSTPTTEAENVSQYNFTDQDISIEERLF